MPVFKVNYDTCPNQNLVPGFRRWVEEGILPGGFMISLLENDLLDAASRADRINSMLLINIVLWVCNELPGSCYGSRNAVTDWPEKRKEIINIMNQKIT